MATIASLALAIRARTEKLKQDLKPALDEIKAWGASAVAAGGDAREVNREMARMRAEALKGTEAAGRTGSKFTETLRNARTAASALTGAISAVSGELGGAVGHVTRLGSSIAQAFLAGGPIAAGVTAITAGISALVGANNEAAEAAKKAAEEHRRWLDDARQRAEALRDTVRGIQADLRATSLGAPELSGEFREQLRIDKERANLWKQMNELQESARTERAKRAEMSDAEAWLRQHPDQGPRGMAKAFDRSVEDERQAKEKIAKLQETLDALAEEEKALDDVRRVQQEAAAEQAAADAQRKKDLAEQKKQNDEIAASIKDAVEHAVRWAGAQAKVADETERTRRAMIETADKAREQRDAQNQTYWDDLRKGAEAGNLRISKLQDERAKAKSSAAERVQALRDELQDLQAGNRFARERIQIGRELDKSLKAAHAAKAGEAEVDALRAVAAARIAKLSKEEAEAVRRSAEEKARMTKEMREQAELARKQLDITKRFAALPGTGGAFGFGAGTAGLGWSGGSGDMGRRRGQRPPSAKDQLGAPAASAVDSSAKLKAIEGAWSKLPEAIAREKAALSSLEKSVLDGTSRILKATEKSIASLKATVREHERRIREGEKRLARVADVGVD